MMKLDDSWIGREGEIDGIPFLLRFRPHLQNFIDAESYNTRLEITWNYESTAASQMPGAHDHKLMVQVEDALVSDFESDFIAVLAFAYTGHNQKVWTWYTCDIGLTGIRLNKVLAEFERLPIDLSSQNDPDWLDYLDVVEG